MDQRVSEFLEFLTVDRDASPHTVAAYRRDLITLFAFLTEHRLDPDTLRGEDLVPYALTLQARGLAPASVRRHLASARTFLRHRMRSGDRTASVRDVPLPKLPPRVPRSLTSAQAIALVERPDASPRGLRDRAALELLYGAGLRVSELVFLRPGDVDRDLGLVRCIGKGDRERIVPCGRQALAALERYLARGRPYLGRTQEADALILNARGRRASRQAIFEIVRAHATMLGLPDWVTPHTLRHAFATHLVEGGADLRTVQELLGHRRIATTEIYTHLAGVHLRESFEAAHPRARRARVEDGMLVTGTVSP